MIYLISDNVTLTFTDWNEPTRALLALLHLLPPTAGGRSNKTKRETAISAVEHLIVFQKVC